MYAYLHTQAPRQTYVYTTPPQPVLSGKFSWDLSLLPLITGVLGQTWVLTSRALMVRPMHTAVLFIVVPLSCVVIGLLAQQVIRSKVLLNLVLIQVINGTCFRDVIR